MPAVDSPDPGGVTPEHLTELLRRPAPGAAGAQATIFAADLDPQGRAAALLADVLTQGFATLGVRAESAP